MFFVTLLGTLLTGVGALSIYLYYFRKGHFEDIEDVKYEMFRDED